VCSSADQELKLRRNYGVELISDFVEGRDGLQASARRSAEVEGKAGGGRRESSAEEEKEGPRAGIAAGWS
jgi:hypothetical protein